MRVSESCSFTLRTGTFKRVRQSSAYYPALGRMALTRRYNAIVQELGGTEELWDTWCAYVVGRDSHYENAFQVSRLHAEAFHLV